MLCFVIVFLGGESKLRKEESAFVLVLCILSFFHPSRSSHFWVLNSWISGGTLSIRPKLPEISVEESNRKEISQNKFSEFWVYPARFFLDCNQSLFCSRIREEERKIFEERVTRASGKAASSVSAGIAEGSFAARVRDSPLEYRARPVFCALSR